MKYFCHIFDIILGESFALIGSSVSPDYHDERVYDLRNKVKLIILLLCVSLFTLVGCNNSQTASEKKPDQINQVFLMYEETGRNEDDQSIGDLYLVKEGKEKEKISSDVLDGFYYYINSQNKVLFINDDHELYEFKTGKEKKKLAEDVAFVNGEKVGELITFQNNDGDLYTINNEGEKEKVASNVMQYELIGKQIYYLDDDYNFTKYHLEDRVEVEIANDVYYFISLNGKEEIAYLNDDYALFYKSGDDAAIKITSDEVSSVSIQKIGSDLVYYNVEDGDFDLYSSPIKEGSTSTKIASDVQDFYFYKDYFYYVNSDGNLYKKKNSEENATKLTSDVVDFTMNDDNIFYLNDERTLYKLVDSEKSKIASSIMEYEVSPKGDVVYTTEDLDLFVNNKKIASEIERFKHFYGHVAFAGDDDKLYLMENMGEKKVIVEDLTEFSNASYQNSVIYVNQLTFKDIAGTWKVKNDATEFYIEIEKDGLFTYLQNGETEQFEQGYSNYQSFNAYSDISDITFSIDKDKKLSMSFAGMDLKLTKSSEEEAKKYYAQLQLEKDMEEIEELMGNYLNDFEYAVNTGYDFYIEEYLDPSSPMYNEQLDFVVGAYESDISEELEDYSVDDITHTGDGVYTVKTTEVFTIYTGYEDYEGTTNTYNNTYTVITRDGEYFITDIKASEAKSDSGEAL